MAIDPRISLAVRGPDIGAAFQNALTNVQNIQASKRQQELQPLRNQLLQTQTQQAQIGADTAREQQRFASIAQGALEIQPSLVRSLETGNTAEVESLLNRRISNLQARQQAGENVDATDSIEALQILKTQGPQALLNSANDAISAGTRLGVISTPVQRVLEKPAGQREFEAKLEGLTPEQQKEAKLIDLGLSPRAVGSAIQTISDQGIAEDIGKAEATITERKKFGEMTGASRAKTIDKGFERIANIDAGIAGIDRAINAVKGGAGTGALQKFLPSIKAASVELDQIKNELALDVIGGVTLGAISESELELVKQVALPTGLNGPELIQHLEDRKAAQQKLRAYFNEQIQFLDQGGTVAGFLRSKEREQPVTASQPQAAPATNRIRFDAQGNIIP